MLFLRMITKLDSLRNTYYSLEDGEFLDTVIADVKSFNSTHWSNSKAVLVFPPFNNYRRFLVHKVVHDIFSDEGLSTFSIGQDLSRRIVVCSKLLLIDKFDVEDSDDSTQPSKKMKEEKPKPAAVTNKDLTRTRTPTVNIYRPPAARIAETKSSPTITEEIKVKDARRTRVRRPDQQVYVPRPKRASFGAINNSPVPDSSSNKESLRRIVNDPIVELNSRSSNKQQIDNGSYRNSVQEDSSFSEDNSSLSSCETSSTNVVAVTNLHINGTQSGLSHSDDDTMQSSCERLQSCSVLNNCLGDSKYSNDNNDQSVLVLEKNYVSLTQLNRSHDFRNDKSNDCEYLNSSCSISNSSFNITRDQNCSFDANEEKVKIITSLHSREEDERCMMQKKKQMEVICIEPETTSVVDSKETVEQNETKGNSQSISVDCLSSSDTETNCDVGNTALNISVTQLSDTIETDSNSYSSGKQKNNVDVVDKSSHEDRNLKNRRILHSFSPISDVLIISDPVKNEAVIKNEISDKKPVETTANDETKTNNKLGNKVNSPSEKSKTKKDSKNGEVTELTAVSVNRDECDWESMFTEDGECLVPGLIEELTRNVGRVKVATAESDYRSYQTSDERSTDGECIIEIYDFPAEFKTHDLLTVFAAYRNRNFHIKWVDDTHALGVFSSPLVADEVLALDLPFVKTRPLRLGIAESKIKARNLILPPMERPKTCTAMARRLVTGALGLRLPSASKEREAERKMLSEARDTHILPEQMHFLTSVSHPEYSTEDVTRLSQNVSAQAKQKRRLEAKQREAIWEGQT